MPLNAPFAYFGGKRKVANIVWQRLGDVVHYVEPFFGSGAVLLGRPHDLSVGMARAETVNDFDGMVCNFWRSIRQDPEKVMFYASYPVIESEMRARISWMFKMRPSMSERLEEDVEWYDAEAAGWWLWGKGCTIANNADRERSTSMPKIYHFGSGVNSATFEWDLIFRLSERMRRVRVLCGDWARLINTIIYSSFNSTGVFLDPPYLSKGVYKGLYNEERPTLIQEVFKFCKENEGNPKLRIALAGYDEDYELPNWELFRWRAHGGYGLQTSNNRTHALENRAREVIWFSPHCIRIETPTF